LVFSDPAFLFYFLPIALFTYWVGGWRKRNLYLLIISLFFYISGGGSIVVLLVLSGMLTYFAALLIDRSNSESTRKVTRNLVVALLIGFLIFWKYTDFLLTQLSTLLRSFGSTTSLSINLILPIAISFFTFQCVSYLIDVSRREIKAEVNLTTFLCYLFFFPHLLAGPVVRYKDVAPQLGTKPSKILENFVAFSPRFFWGLAKKVLIADQAAQIANSAFGIAGYQIQTLDVIIGVIAYSIQIYFDFSGYSDMAIALAGMFGIKFHENFLRPYSASSVTDFWRRWHVSLSSWFKDYLYIPLGGNRGSALKTYRNLAIVFVLTGFWHGANWTFLVWGIIHGTALIIERLFLQDQVPRRVLARVILRLWTVLVVLFAWLFFRSDSLAHSGELLKALIGGAGFGISPIVEASITPQRIFWTAIGLIVFFLPQRRSIGQLLNDTKSHQIFSFVAVGMGLLASMYVLSSSFSPFLYFQF
jgi:alginate O-acetyltransferase complex protein AlgI